MHFTCLVIGKNPEDQISEQDEILRLEREKRMFFKGEIDECDKWNSYTFIKSKLKKDINNDDIKISAIIFNKMWFEINEKHRYSNNNKYLNAWLNNVDNIMNQLKDDTLLSFYHLHQ